MLVVPATVSPLWVVTDRWWARQGFALIERQSMFRHQVKLRQSFAGNLKAVSLVAMDVRTRVYRGGEYLVPGARIQELKRSILSSAAGQICFGNHSNALGGLSVYHRDASGFSRADHCHAAMVADVGV